MPGAARWSRREARPAQPPPGTGVLPMGTPVQSSPAGHDAPRPLRPPTAGGAGDGMAVTGATAYPQHALRPRRGKE